MNDDRCRRDHGDEQPGVVYEWTEGIAADLQQASSEGDDQQWPELLARYETLQLAARMAWEALLDAYMPASDGSINPTPELLERYQEAAALRQAAAFALFKHVLVSRRMSAD